jgi:hypothetical protein
MRERKMMSAAAKSIDKAMTNLAAAHNAGFQNFIPFEQFQIALPLVARWIASLALATTAVMGSRIIKIVTSSLGQLSQYLLSRRERLLR